MRPKKQRCQLKSSFLKSNLIIYPKKIVRLLANTALFIDFKTSILHIDPLDGTRNFAKGELECVTCLFGIAVNDRAQYGVIHHPKSYDEGVPPATYFGGSKLGLYKKLSDSKDLQELKEYCWKED